MLSIVPGPPSKPTASQPSKNSKSNGFGRKIVDRLMGKGRADATPEKPPVKRSKGNTTMEELDRMLDNDHVALLSMKKDIGAAQKEELNKAISALLDLQKQNDGLKLSNELKERELKNINDSIAQLQSLQAIAGTSSAVVTEVKNSVMDELNTVKADLEAELKTHKVLILMSKRLQDEITACRVETTKTQFSLDQVKHDLEACESSLRLSKQELAVQEKQVESLNRVVKSRKEERAAKLKQLRSLVNEGETSVQTVKQLADTTALDRTGRSAVNEPIETSDSPRSKAIAGRKSPTNQPGPAAFHNSLNLIAGLDELLLGPDTDLSHSGKFASSPHITHEISQFAQIREIIDRYSSHQSRIEKLQQFSSELKGEIQRQQLRNKELSDQLEQSAASQEVLSSNRQIYQEVDMKDNALASARKECDDCRWKEYRLRVNIESLKRCLPRFLTKVTKVVHPVPTVEQLPDAVHKLEDEIAKLIKYIGAAIVKDATPDDLAVLTASGTGPMGNGGSSTMPSGSSSDVNSEIGRIRKLPGYQRLQRQLFINLMSAKQDNTDRNVRVLSEFRAVSSHTERPDTSSNAYGDDSSTAISVVPPAGAPLQNGRSKRSDIPVAGVDTIDRATVKLISEMVREKNSSNNATNNNLGKYARR